MTPHPASKSHRRQNLSDRVIERLADEAEQGYEVDEVIARRGRRGRPPLGSEASRVESFRIDTDLSRLLTQRAEKEGVSVSDVIREALRRHLAPAE